MLVFVETASQKTQTSEIWESGEEKLLALNELREKYIGYARRRFIKIPPLVVGNQQTGWVIEITTQVLKEWRQKSRTRPRIIAIRLLDEMLKTASLIKTGEDAKKTRGIESVSEFENCCKIEGKRYKIRIIIKKQANRHFVYYYGAVNTEFK